ncbi:MAG: hypothetical protein JSW11_10365 [Candidatus Heimdallarchaeota archaeon]|nr:MAG: hypothetical protein JSW11_10365 [Candidatus Heimdallarchaeota archaeon]
MDSLDCIPSIFLGFMFIFIGIVYLPSFLRSPTEQIYIGFVPSPAYFAVFAVIIGVGLWVLFLSNIYISFGLARLHYFRWKLLVIESGLLGIVLGLVSIYFIIGFSYNLQYSFLQNLVRIFAISLG